MALVAKSPLAVAESAADVFTLGLAEAVLTPTEGVTKNEQHPVTFCYKNNSLVRVVHAGSPATDSGVPEQTTQAQTEAPSPSPISSPVPSASSSPSPNKAPSTAPSSSATPAQAAALQK